MDTISHLCDLIDNNYRISKYLKLNHLKERKSDYDYPAEWMYLLSFALSFERFVEKFDMDLFGDFKLSNGVAQKLLATMEHVFHQSWPQIITGTDRQWLKKEIEDLRRSWLSRSDDYQLYFQRQMHYLSKLTHTIVYQVDWHLATPNEKKAAENDVLDLIHALVTTAYDIINHANYEFDHTYKMDRDNVEILYLVFGLFPHSISTAGLDLNKFQKSLRFRSEFDIYVFDCLFEYKEIHDLILPHGYRFHPHAIDDMLVQVSPSDLVQILMKVYPKPNRDGETFLHVLAFRNKFAFAKLFPFCTDLWKARNSYGLTPMAVLFLDNPYNGWHEDGRCSSPPSYTDYGREVSMNDLLFDVVSDNSNYFASNVLK